MNSRRGLLLSLAGCVVAGALMLIAAGRVWGRATLTAATGARVLVTATGHAAEPALPALGVALVVLTAGVIATHGWLRRAVGVIVVVVGAAAIALGAASRSDVAAALERHAFGVARSTVAQRTSGWAVVTIIAGVVAVASGALIVAFGARWPGLGARYDSPTTPKPPREGSEWEALDRGEDPTL